MTIMTSYDVTMIIHSPSYVRIQPIDDNVHTQVGRKSTFSMIGNYHVIDIVVVESIG